MTDQTWRRDEIESPCVKLCILDPETGLCMGCYRTGDEIAGWARMSPEERRAVMTALPDRAPLVAKGRRGGRKGRLSRDGA